MTFGSWKKNETANQASQQACNLHINQSISKSVS